MFSAARGRYLACATSRRCLIAYSFCIGLAIGGIITWYASIPVPPWITLKNVAATYRPGTGEIHVTGHYTARKTCSREEQNTKPGEPDPLVWRQEVRGTGPEIVYYAPVPAPPSLEYGTHYFDQEIPLAQGISPDGWSVSVIVSCSDEAVAIRSQPALVKFIYDLEY